MVRSIKSGLPLNDAIRMISAEGQEPVRTEFKRIVEAQQMGMNIPEACARLYTRIPLSEANFFAIVIAIQARPAATFPKRSATCPASCAIARR
jgi:tight adherence protein B